jgi:ATP-dependent RNA helicase DeaD
MRFFSTFQLRPEITKAALKLFKEPTNIQYEAIPKILEKQNVVINAETGSGKTLAYMLPLISNLKDNRNVFNRDSPELLILVPNKHLQMQTMSVLNEVSKLMSKELSFSVVPAPILPTAHREPIQIGVGVPSSILSVYKKHNQLTKFLENTRMIAIDEVDFIFSDPVGLELWSKLLAILQSSKRKDGPAQYCFIAATLPPEKDSNHKTPSFIIKKGLRKTHVEIIQTNEIHATPAGISSIKLGLEEVFIRITEENKSDLLMNLINGLKDGDQCIVFCSSGNSSKKVFNSLSSLPINLVCINDEMRREDRTALLLKLANSRPQGKPQVIVATDMISRGTDFKHTNVIIHFDFPKFAKDYIHRVGRTCRGLNENGKCKLNLI